MPSWKYIDGQYERITDEYDMYISHIGPHEGWAIDVFDHRQYDPVHLEAIGPFDTLREAKEFDVDKHMRFTRFLKFGEFADEFGEPDNY